MKEKSISIARGPGQVKTMVSKSHARNVKAQLTIIKREAKLSLAGAP